MKYSNVVGVLSAIAIIAICFTPWVYIAPINTTITGWMAPGTSFGKPGLMNMIISSLAIVCFILPFVWAKRLNIFLCALNLAWLFRNYIVLTQCHMGECPVMLWGLYLLLIFSILMLVMGLLPKVPTRLSAS